MQELRYSNVLCVCRVGCSDTAVDICFRERPWLLVCRIATTSTWFASKRRSVAHNERSLPAARPSWYVTAGLILSPCWHTCTCTCTVRVHIHVLHFLKEWIYRTWLYVIFRSSTYLKERSYSARTTCTREIFRQSCFSTRSSFWSLGPRMARVRAFLLMHNKYCKSSHFSHSSFFSQSLELRLESADGVRRSRSRRDQFLCLPVRSEHHVVESWQHCARVESGNLRSSRRVSVSYQPIPAPPRNFIVLIDEILGRCPTSHPVTYLGAHINHPSFFSVSQTHADIWKVENVHTFHTRIGYVYLQLYSIIPKDLRVHVNM